MRFEIAFSVLNRKCGSICAELRGTDLAGAPHSKLAHREHDDENDRVEDHVLLQLVETSYPDIAEVVTVARDRVGELAQHDHAGGVRGRESHERGGVGERDGSARFRVDLEASFEAHDERQQREHRDYAAELPDQRLPPCIARIGADADELIQPLVDAEQQRTDEVHRPRRERAARAAARRVRRAGGRGCDVADHAAQGSSAGAA
jgi:hypothetical protein